LKLETQKKLRRTPGKLAWRKKESEGDRGRRKKGGAGEGERGGRRGGWGGGGGGGGAKI